MRLLPVLVAAALAAALLAPGAARAITGPFHTDGRWIKDPEGRTVIVHGLQIAHKLPPYHPRPREFGARDARLIAGLGLDVVRVAWMWKGLEPTRGRIDDGYRGEIAREVRTLAKAGVLTLLEAHQDAYNEQLYGVGFPDWATLADGGYGGPPRTGIRYTYPGIRNAFSNLYHDRQGIAARFAAAWRELAAAVQPSRRFLFGYDLINEPWPGGGGPGCARICVNFDHRLLGPFETRLARAVRTVDRTTPVFYEPHQQFDFGARTALRRPPKAVQPAGFAFHAYCAPKRGQPLIPNAESRSPGYAACLRDVAHVFDNAQATSRRLNTPALLGEFGDTGDAAFVETQLERADENRTGWLYWSYKDFADIPGGRGDGSLFADDDRFDTLLRSREALLARAYPEATAGEPLWWHWDPTEGPLQPPRAPGPTRHRPDGDLPAGADALPPRLCRQGQRRLGRLGAGRGPPEDRDDPRGAATGGPGDPCQVASAGWMSASLTSARSLSATTPSARPTTRRSCSSWASARRWSPGTRTSAPSSPVAASTSCATTTATAGARRASTPTSRRPPSSC